MDQISLYEKQVNHGKSVLCNSASALVKRDRFLINYLLNSVDDQKFELETHVAELSIGEGRLSELLLKSLPNIRLTCADISKARISFVIEKLKCNDEINSSLVTFIECNFDTEFEKLPSNAFNVVIALDIMEHVFDVFGFVDNCYRLLVKGGTMFIRVPNIAYIKHRVRLLAGKLPVTASWYGPKEDFKAWRDQHGWDGGHLHLFTIQSLVKLLNDTGFSIMQCADPGTKYSSIRDLMPNLLYSNPLIVAVKKDKSAYI